MFAAPQRLSIAAAATVAVAATLIFTGCSTAKPPVTHSPTPAAAINGLPDGVKPAPVPTDVPNSVAARKNVTVTGCSGDADGWKASGTITNPAKATTDYTITVFFTTPAATVIDTAQTKVTVHAGATQKWSAAKTFTTGGHVLCVLRGVG